MPTATVVAALPSHTRWTTTPLGRWLTANQITLREVAERVGFAKAYVHQFLCGYKVPSPEALVRLRAALKVPGDVLLDHVAVAVEARDRAKRAGG